MSIVFCININGILRALVIVPNTVCIPPHTPSSVFPTFQYLVENTEGTPSISTLKTEFPSLFFDNIQSLKDDEINDYISLFISNRKQAYTSRLLIDLAAKVRAEGITEDITNKLNNITKSDVVKKPYVNRGKSILDFYNSKKDLTRYKYWSKKNR